MPVIDIHVHLAGLTGDPSGCHLSPRMQRSLNYHGLLRLNRMPRRDPVTATLAYADRLIRLVESSTELDYACVFAMDGVYDGGGQFDAAESHLFVPDRYVFVVCARSPKLLPVISINPQRHDAMAELARWGPLAVAIKWLGPLQKFDPTNPAYVPFYDAMREMGLPLIAHSGCEHTFPGMAQRLGDPLLYEPLAKRGIPIVFCHCGTGSILYPRHDYSAQFVQMLERYDHVYGDTSGFCSLLRRKEVRRFAADRYIGRILHGSDFPTPTNAFPFLTQLGFDGTVKLERINHPFDRDIRTKRALGVPDATLTAAHTLLATRIAAWEVARTVGEFRS
ncbi:MAG: amidohydrolase family protein [Candidatus Sericytochromatia bacterium]|nr:amidohydrolase family protein [Candidatus Sericytochromatia bacterium]